MSGSQTRVLLIVILIAIALVAGIIWANYLYSYNNPGGFQFFVKWKAVQEFIYKDANPYDDNLAERIQADYQKLTGSEITESDRWNYPFYGLWIYLPFSLIKSYTLARAIWMTVLEIALLAIAFFSTLLIEWKPPVRFLPLYFIFALFWFYSVYPLLNGDDIILVAFFILASILLMKHKRYDIAGMLLAFSTIRLYSLAIVILLILLWSSIDYSRRMLAWFFGTIIVVGGLSFPFLPAWLLETLRVIIQFSNFGYYYHPSAVLANWFPGIGTQIGWLISTFVAIVMVWETWVARDRDFRWKYWAFCLIASLTPLCGMPTASETYIILFPGIALICSTIMMRWRRGGPYVVLGLILLLFFGMWIVNTKVMLRGFESHPFPSTLLPAPVILSIGLFWIRWWAVTPPRLWLEETKEKIEADSRN